MADYLSSAMQLYMNELIDWDTYFQRRKGDSVDVAAEREALLEVLRTCASICKDLEPGARSGWEEEARIENGEVVLPRHVQEGYERLREAGLVAVRVAEQYGGFALPNFVMNAVMQMVARADLALHTVVGLQAGVADDIEVFASEELRERYLPGFASGELWGAMDLTEPQAGSDLGAIVTRAFSEGDRHFIEGQKIFITNGGAQIHLVLARDDESFDASKGTTEGLSLYLVPRTLPDGTPNAVSIERLEEKMGLHGSATAVVRFARAEGFRIYERGKGFKAMLQLMNNARVGVAAQGVGIAEASLAEALRYAREREQFGRPIGDQPLMKSMLTRMTLAVEASRALLYRTCRYLDRNEAIASYLAREADLVSDAERAELERQQSRNTVCVRLLTPLAKYLATESCDQVTRMAIQVHGGVGFMRETNVGKLHLDGIITTIYEGTSEIQVSFALKEIGRGALAIVFDELREELSKHDAGPLAEAAARIGQAIEQINEASTALMRDFNYALLCARLVAEMVIIAIVGTELLAQAAADPKRADIVHSYLNRKLPELEMYARRVSEGGTERLERYERIIALASS